MINFDQLEALDQAPDNPFTLFDEWYKKAEQHGPIDSSAMSLATAGNLGRPSVRMLRLKG